MESEYDIDQEFWLVEEDDLDFTTLDAWKKARKVKLFFYQKVLPKLPKEEKYQLGTQIRDASVSGTANIAEGYGRFHYQKVSSFIEFLVHHSMNLKII
ncbi:MAG TPA: four helix bundle protein [Balneolaceae bacterium]|nr:four helix bundle protein [Balneolaceae bacterium]